MNQRYDIGWEANFAADSIAVTDGVWSATNQNGVDNIDDSNLAWICAPSLARFASDGESISLAGRPRNFLSQEFGIVSIRPATPC